MQPSNTTAVHQSARKQTAGPRRVSLFSFINLFGRQNRAAIRASKDFQAGKRGVISRRRKNPFRGIACPQSAYPEARRHILA